MENKIGLDKFCDYLSKINMDFTDFILEDWESVEEGNVKLNGLTEKQWMNLYVQFSMLYLKILLTFIGLYVKIGLINKFRQKKS